MKSSITNRQMFFLLFLTLTTYTVISIPGVIARTSGSGGWVSIMITSFFFAAFSAVLIRLNSAFPGMMLYEYSRRIAGPFLAYILGIYFICYFFLVSVYLSIQLISVLKAEFYPKTPSWVMLAASVTVFGTIAYRGAANVARFFEIIGVAFLVTAIVTHLVMFQQGRLEEIRPLFRVSQVREYLLGVKDVIIAFLGIELLTVFPLSGKNSRRSVLTAAMTVLVVGLFYVLVTETCIMMLGMKSAENYNFALIEAIKQIDNPILERFDILYLTVGFAGLVAGTSGVYLALVEYAIRLFAKTKRIFVTAGAGVVIVVLGIAAQSMKSARDMLEAALTAAGLVSAFFIPAALLLTAKVRGLVQKPQ